MTHEINRSQIPLTGVPQSEILDQNNSRSPLPAAVRERFSGAAMKPSAPSSFAAAATPPAGSQGVSKVSRDAIERNPQNQKAPSTPPVPLLQPQPRFVRKASSSSDAPQNPTEALIDRLELRKLPLDKLFDLDSSEGANGKKCSAEIRSSASTKLIHDDREIPSYLGAGIAGAIGGGAAYFGLAVVAWPAALIAGLCAAIGIYFRVSSDHPTVKWAKEILSRNLFDLLRNPPQRNEERLTDKTYCIWFREAGGRVVWSGLAEQRTIKEAPGFINREEERDLEFAIELNLSRHTYRIFMPQGSRIQASHLLNPQAPQMTEEALVVIVDPISGQQDSAPASSSTSMVAPQREFASLFDGFETLAGFEPGGSVHVPSDSGNSYNFRASIDGKHINLDFTIGNKNYLASVHSGKDTPEGIVNRRFLEQFRSFLAQGKERREAFNLAKKSIVGVLLNKMREHPAAEAELARVSGLDVKTFFTEQKLDPRPASSSSKQIPSTSQEALSAGGSNQDEGRLQKSTGALADPVSLGSAMEIPKAGLPVSPPCQENAEAAIQQPMVESLAEKAMQDFHDLMMVQLGSQFEMNFSSQLRRIFITELGDAYQPSNDLLKDIARAGDILNRKAAACYQVVATTPHKDPIYARSKSQLDGLVTDIEILEKCKKIRHSQSSLSGMPKRLIMPQEAPLMSSSSSDAAPLSRTQSAAVSEGEVLDILDAELGGKFHTVDAKLVQQAEIKIMGRLRSASNAEEKLQIQAKRQMLLKYSIQMKKKNPGWGKASLSCPSLTSPDASRPSSSTPSSLSKKVERIETLEEKSERLLNSGTLDAQARENLEFLKAELAKHRGDLGKIEILLENYAKAIKRQGELQGKRNPTAEDKTQLEKLNGYLQNNSLSVLTAGKRKIIGEISKTEHAISSVCQNYQ